MSARLIGALSKDGRQTLKNGIVKTRVAKSVTAAVAVHAARRGLKSAQIVREAIWEYLQRHPLPPRKKFVEN